jgi:DNA-binding response OmpR family regulator
MTPDSAEPSQSSVRKSVLILDQGPERSAFLRDALRTAGCDAEFAGDFETASAQLHTRRPDAILANLHLPGPSGLPLARSLLVDPDLDGVPILALTPDRHSILQHREMADLFDGYLCEPIDPVEILCHLQTPPATVRESARSRSLARLSREMQERDPDPAQALEALRVEYIRNQTAGLAALAGAINRVDFETLERAAHNLKGTGAAYGFAELTELGRALESAAKHHDIFRADVLLGETAFYLNLVQRNPVHP